MKKKYKTKVKKPDFDEPKTVLGCHIFLEQGMEGIPEMFHPVIVKNVRFLSDVAGIARDMNTGCYGCGHPIAIIENEKVIPIEANVNLWTVPEENGYCQAVQELYEEALNENEIIELRV